MRSNWISTLYINILVFFRSNWISTLYINILVFFKVKLDKYFIHQYFGFFFFEVKLDKYFIHQYFGVFLCQMRLKMLSHSVNQGTLVTEFLVSFVFCSYVVHSCHQE